jgi:hypothetical protein
MDFSIIDRKMIGAFSIKNIVSEFIEIDIMSVTLSELFKGYTHDLANRGNLSPEEVVTRFVRNEKIVTDALKFLDDAETNPTGNIFLTLIGRADASVVIVSQFDLAMKIIGHVRYRPITFGRLNFSRDHLTTFFTAAIERGVVYADSIPKELVNCFGIFNNTFNQLNVGDRQHIKKGVKSDDKKSVKVIKPRVGDIVTRGPTWEWRDQDSFDGNYGIITNRKSRSTYRVTWMDNGEFNGHENTYRMNTEFQDLIIIARRVAEQDAAKKSDRGDDTQSGEDSTDDSQSGEDITADSQSEHDVGNQFGIGDFIRLLRDKTVAPISAVTETVLTVKIRGKNVEVSRAQAKLFARSINFLTNSKERLDPTGADWTCCLCQTEIDNISTRFVKPAKKCDCRIHLNCALEFVQSFIGHLADKNPLERKILRCPGCKGDICPSFLTVVKKFFSIPKNFFDLLEEIERSGGQPRLVLDSFKRCRGAFDLLSDLDLKVLNINYLFIKFRTDPRFVACPDEKCREGFALIPPDEEHTLECFKCRKPQRFVGTKRQAELAGSADRQLVTEILKSRNIKGCTFCGKLAEKIDGCDNVTCTACGRTFRWDQVDTKDSSKFHL